MSTVDEWAKREAEERYHAPRMHVGTASEREVVAGAWGITHLAALLLSDEAVEAAHAKLFRSDVNPVTMRVVRAALEAALTKITEDKE